MFSELKRRLDDQTTPLPKRLCLAKNIVHSHHFPTAPKERIIADWLEVLSKSNKLDSTELPKVLEWLNYDELTGELKSKIIQVCKIFYCSTILASDLCISEVRGLPVPHPFSCFSLPIICYVVIY